MKRIILSALLCICALSSFRGFAAEASADDVSVYLLKDWVSEKYGCKIDQDGDLILNGDSGKIIVSVIRKARLIRLHSFYSAYKKRSITEMKLLANKFNDAKRILRVCINLNGTSVCDYYIIYNGGLNSQNFLKTLDWFANLENDWVNYVINGGDSE